MPISGSGIQYAVRIRDASFNILAELDDYESLDYTARFNDVGEWTLVISKASPHASLLVRGNGIVVSDVDNGFVVFSGPIRTVTRLGTNQSQNLTLAGWDDMVWLKRRLTWPAEGYYGAVITDAPIRYYRLSEGGVGPGVAPVTTVAHDFGSQARDGTYHPDNSNLVPNVNGGGLPFDTDSSFIGTGAAYVDCPTTSMPTGNAAMGIDFLLDILVNPGSNVALLSYGVAVAHELFQFNLLTTGAVQLTIFGAAVTSGVLATGQWHHIAGAWNGTTLTLYVDGASVGTATPGAQTIPSSGTKFRIAGDTGATVGSILGALQLIDEVAVYTTTLTAGRVLAHSNRSGAHNPSNPTGAFTQAAYDVQGGQASTLIDHYVRYNLGPHANTDRWPGSITNPARAALTMSADPLIGGTVAAASRLDNLLLMCQVLALGGGDFGFKIVQSAVGGSASGALTFTIFQPVNRTNIIFDELAGTLGEYTFIQDESTDNCCIVGGTGTGTARTFVYQSDAVSLAIFGRIEGLLNASSTGDLPTLNNLGYDEVTKNSSDHAVTATPVEVTHMVYGVDYALGDQVTIVVDGTTVTDTIREAALSLNPTDGAYWTPTIGSPAAKSANDLLKDLYKSIKRAGSRIQFLDSVQ